MHAKRPRARALTWNWESAGETMGPTAGLPKSTTSRFVNLQRNEVSRGCEALLLRLATIPGTAAQWFLFPGRNFIPGCGKIPGPDQRARRFGYSTHRFAPRARRGLGPDHNPASARQTFSPVSVQTAATLALKIASAPSPPSGLPPPSRRGTRDHTRPVLIRATTRPRPRRSCNQLPRHRPVRIALRRFRPPAYFPR